MTLALGILRPHATVLCCCCVVVVVAAAVCAGHHCQHTGDTEGFAGEVEPLAASGTVMGGRGLLSCTHPSNAEIVALSTGMRLWRGGLASSQTLFANSKLLIHLKGYRG